MFELGSKFPTTYPLLLYVLQYNNVVYTLYRVIMLRTVRFENRTRNWKYSYRTEHEIFEYRIEENEIRTGFVLGGFLLLLLLKLKTI